MTTHFASAALPSLRFTKRFAVVISLLATGMLSAQTYSLVDLGTLPGATTSAAADINDGGQVIGSSSGRAFLWDSGTFTELVGLDGGTGNARSINNNGQVVGSSFDLFVEQRAVLWTDSSVPAMDIGDIVNNDSFSLGANDINDQQQIVGSADSNTAARAFLWQNGSMSELTGQGTARGINNLGAIVGNAEFAFTSHAFLIDAQNTMTDLGDLMGGTGFSFASDINDAGQIIGGSQTMSGGNHGFFVSGGIMTDLGDLPGGLDSSYVSGINESGVVVGRSGVLNGNHAFLWQLSTGMQDLNGLVNATAAGWVLQSASAINASGQIVGSGLNPAGEQRAFLLRQGLLCDFDADGQCDAADLDLLYGAFGGMPGLIDLNQDAIVNADDINAWLSIASDPANPHTNGYRTFRQGDVNLDGSVESVDLGILLNNFGDTSRKMFAEGNVNGDNEVNSIDLGLLLNDFGFISPSPAVVPEPCGHLMVLLAFLGLLIFGRRK